MKKKKKGEREWKGVEEELEIKGNGRKKRR